jgi:hypothetical protein
MKINAETNKSLLHNACLTAWIKSIQNGNLQKAIEIDFYHYDSLVKPNEDKYYWDKWQLDTHNFRNELTEQCKIQIPSEKKIPLTRRFLIVHHNFSGLAHETQLARNLDYLRDKEKGIEFDVLYLFGPPIENYSIVEQIYNLKKSNIHFLNSKSYIDAAGKLDTFVNNNEYASIVYPSVFFTAFWMSLFVRHENQKFLVLKYFPIQSGRINEWACIRRTEDAYLKVKNQCFTQLSLLDLNVSKFIIKEPVQYPKNLTFGSISRKEKTTDTTYKKFVKDKLHGHPDLYYLYTERIDENSSSTRQERHGYKAVNLGWVNPEKAIGEFSIYLEPFPWGGGEMSFLAINSGIPYLTLDTPENRSVGLYLTLELIARPRNQILKASFCKSLDNLSSTFDELVTNKDFRESIGIEWKKAASTYQPINPNNWLTFVAK